MALLSLLDEVAGDLRRLAQSWDALDHAAPVRAYRLLTQASAGTNLEGVDAGALEM